MNWQQVHLRLSSDSYTIVEETLEGLGALSITLKDAEDNPIFEPPLGETPLWRELKVTALFDFDTDVSTVHDALHQLAQVDVLEWSSEVVEEEDWERKWMDQFEPMRYGDRLWVVPSWLDAPDPNAVNLILDPGLAFGSGTHETTTLCLQWLADNEVAGESVIDYGCGSGILAIAALKLGAAAALGVDIDPQALTASRENAARNQIPGDAFPVVYPEQVTCEPSDVMIANILSGPLVELSPILAALTRAGGRIVLSGILHEQAQSVCDAYSKWFELDPVAQLGDWCRISGRKTR